ncbi:MAG: hypothetical protein IJR51_06715 [Clostridia bacterium]|nr:hypothetical protein [Clostridia bacterium]MBQ9506832.1 hypothetical protein [Clostridia bacterium]
MECLSCGKALTVYDIGFYKKMVNRGAAECACISCTAAHFRITEARACEMIRRFQKTGCTLFPMNDEG